MKIHVQGADLRGRFHLRDATVDALAKRYRSAKRVYFSASFEQERPHRADCFMITADELLDWILDDTEIRTACLNACSTRFSSIASVAERLPQYSTSAERPRISTMRTLRSAPLASVRRRSSPRLNSTGCGFPPLTATSNV